MMSTQCVMTRKKDLPKPYLLKLDPLLYNQNSSKAELLSKLPNLGVLILQSELSQAENEPDIILNSLNKVFTVGTTN